MGIRNIRDHAGKRGEIGAKTGRGLEVGIAEYRKVAKHWGKCEVLTVWIKAGRRLDKRLTEPR